VGTAIHGKFVIDSSPASAKSYINMKPKKNIEGVYCIFKKWESRCLFLFSKKQRILGDGITSESRASKMVSGIGSGLNSSGTKLLRTLLIIGASNEGHTFRKSNLNNENGERHL
jgi:hypothetical protein